MGCILVDRLVEIDVNAVNGNIFPYEDQYWMVGNDSYDRWGSYLHTLDNGFRSTGQSWFLDRDLEDHRVIFNEGAYHVWCNYGDGTEMRYGKLDIISKTLEVSKVVSKGFEMKDREKNWCPFVRNGKIFVVYSYFPEFVILELKNKSVHEIFLSEKSNIMHRWMKNNVDQSRIHHIGGGSNLICYRGFFIGTLHIKYTNREYLNFLVFFTPDFVVRQITGIDYGKSLFEGERLRTLKTELDRDDDKRRFGVGEYRKSLTKVTFTTGIFLRNDKFHISVGVNDLVTKMAIIGKVKIDGAINSIL